MEQPRLSATTAAVEKRDVAPRYFFDGFNLGGGGGNSSSTSSYSPAAAAAVTSVPTAVVDQQQQQQLSPQLPQQLSPSGSGGSSSGGGSSCADLLTRTKNPVLPSIYIDNSLIVPEPTKQKYQSSREADKYPLLASFEDMEVDFLRQTGGDSKEISNEEIRESFFNI